MAETILVVEDDRKIARVVTLYLEEAGYRVVHAERGQDALREASLAAPILVILDLMLPDMTGEKVFQELKLLGDFPVIMLTAKSGPEERVAGFALGADDYIVKPFNPREMVYRVKAVLKRMPQEAEEGTGEAMSFDQGSLVINSQTMAVTRKGAAVSLTPSEFRILMTFAKAPHRVFTREKLIEKAFGHEFEGYDRTIDVHIKNIRQKIEDDARNPAYIVTVHRVGYKFVAEQDREKPLA